MKFWYKVIGKLQNGESKTIELEATGTGQTRLQDLPIKSALEQMGALEKYEVLLIATSSEDA